MPSIQQSILFLKQFITENRFQRFEDILNNRTKHITVVLEDIFQGHNASAVPRSCDCFGIQDIHFIENNYEFTINEDVSMGAYQWLSVHQYNSKGKNNTIECLTKLKNQGYKILATTPHAKALRIDEIDTSHKTAILFGTEKEGLSNQAIQMADESVYIPMYGFTESFNISVSAALVLYEITKKIRSNGLLEYPLSIQEKEEILLAWIKKSVRNADALLSRM